MAKRMSWRVMGLVLVGLAAGLQLACESTSKVENATQKLRAELASDDADDVSSLIKAGADVKSPDAAGVTPLHLAAMNGHKGAVGKLIAAGAPVNVKDAQGRTPLYHAVHAGHESTVRTLLANDADPDLLPSGSPTLLETARKKGYVDISEILALRNLK